MTKISTILDKALRKIAKKILKEARIPFNIKQFLTLTTDPFRIEIRVFYNKKYVSTLKLQELNQYNSIYFLSKKLRDDLFHYVSKLELIKVIDNNKI